MILRRLQPGQMPTAAEWNALCDMAERAFGLTSDPSTGIEVIRSGGPLSLRLPPKPVNVVKADASATDPSTPGYYDGSVAIYDTLTGLPTEREKCWILPVESIVGSPGPPGGTIELDGFDVTLSNITITGVNTIFFGTGTTAANYPLYLQDLGGGQAEAFFWDAAHNQSGIVNNTPGTGGGAGNPQDFGGNKRFVRQAGAGSPVKGIIVTPYGTGSPFTNDAMLQVLGGTPCVDVFNNVTSAHATTLESDGIHFRLAAAGTVGGNIIGIGGGCQVALSHSATPGDTADFTYDVATTQFVLNVGSTNNNMSYMCGGSVGLSTTINFPKTTGTIVVKGGIIVGVT